MRILVFEPNWLGDVVFTTPAFKALKNNFKDCFIGCVVSKSCAGVLHNNPFVDEIIEFNERGEDRSLRKKILFIQKLKSKKYDMVILLHRSFTRALLMFLAGIKIRIGYASKKRSCLLTKKIPPLNINIIHKQDYYLRILEKTGIKVEDKNCQAYPSLKEKNWADNILKERACGFDYLIAINPSTNWPPKNWPVQYFEKLINILQGELKNIRFFLTSKGGQKKLLPLIEKNKEILADLTGKTSLLELAALYEKMDLVISGDSGPLHLAGAVNTKYLGLYGPTNPLFTGVRAKPLGCIIFKNDFCPTPCYVKNCRKDFLCMKVIKPQEAASEALELLKH